jgi:hypothetical protein
MYEARHVATMHIRKSRQKAKLSRWNYVDASRPRLSLPAASLFVGHIATFAVAAETGVPDMCGGLCRNALRTGFRQICIATASRVFETTWAAARSDRTVT